MAELTTLARPYARAAFKAARAEDALQTWAESLTKAAAVAEHEKVKGVLQSPSLTHAQKADIFTGLLGDVNGQFKNYIAVLSKNNRLALLTDILDMFLALKAEHEKTLDVDIASAFELSETAKNQLSQAISRNLGKTVKVSATLDKSLLGGAVIRTGDTVIDGSVKGRLAKLAESLNA